MEPHTLPGTLRSAYGEPGPSSTETNQESRTGSKQSAPPSPTIADILVAKGVDAVTQFSAQMLQSGIDSLVEKATGIFFKAPVTSTSTVWDSKSVVDACKSRGLPSDIESRAALYKGLGGAGVYSPTAKGNDMLRAMIERKL
ncbi:hypothetical protein BGW36DRAFT_403856 [Talaromyces proteolyticus]|uniref:Uncharacterized protein n=1 Tax=Talaromyces proteolyticus TaxID=1131652 RepID=A0AAD4L0W8_9EURO|nr:uncharacterized protein BGW36DRAFT_403856 [Talaromyces proteolyticus]KAH8703470.1 hypothetical protein BGW36DRAFT_403856 [Talaromyces proteolyticus]